MPMTKFTKHGVEYLPCPYTRDEIEAFVNEDGFIDGNVRVSANEIIGIDFEDFIDLLLYRLVDTITMSDVSYNFMDACDNDTIIIRVGGYFDFDE